MPVYGIGKQPERRAGRKGGTAVFSIPNAVIATALILVLYGLSSFAVRKRWEHSVVLNPLKIIANSSGRASLSSAQVFFFTLIVLWLAIYWAIQEGKLISIDNSVLGLLGIAIVGSGVGKITDSTRFRATGENWAWARRKKWIKKDFTRVSVEREPEIGDLLASDQGFDIARFQAVGFSLVVGIALLYKGATAVDAEAFAKFTIDETYLTLLGVSQGAYVGGKYVGNNLFRELNAKLDKVRSLEVAFISSVASSTEWKDKAAQDRTISLARETCAPNEYVAYMSSATEAAEIVGEMTGNPIEGASIEPELPSVA